MVFGLHSSVGLRAPSTRPRFQQNAVAVLARRSHSNRHPTKRAKAVRTRASGESFDLSMYHEASISEVRSADKHGHVIFLRLKDGQNSVLPVYIGEFECGALVKEMAKKPTPRPGTHDLMKSTLEALGYRVSKIRIIALVGNTYHARVHFARGRGIKPPSSQGEPAAPSATEVDVDARPSDAINLAVRFNAPIYVNKEVAAKMAHPSAAFDDRAVSAAAATGAGNDSSSSSGNVSEITRTCREEILHYADPTIMLKLQLQLAIAEERFEDATKLRDVIEKMLGSDRALALVVAIETALEDGRFEEAARLRDDFKTLRMSQQQNEDQQEPQSRSISDVLDL